MLKATWRSLRAHKARMLLSGLAVVLGVAFVVGTFIFTDTLEGTFDELFAGETPDVVVTQATDVSVPEGTGTVQSSVPQSVVEQVQATDGVARASGSVQAYGVTLLDADGTPVGGNGPPQLGISFPEYPEDPQLSGVSLVEGRQPRSGEIVIDTQTAEKGGFTVGDTVTVVTQGPRIEAPLVGLIRYGVSGSLAGATLTMFDRQYAQQIFLGGADAWSQVGVVADPGASVDTLSATLRESLGSGYQVKTGQELEDEAASQLKTALSFVNTFLLVFAFIALFVGTFIILNTFSMLVARRTRELALLRAIGASKRQITWSVVGEALILGIVGGVLGILVGAGVALGLRSLMGLFGAALPAGRLVVEPRTVVMGLVVGTVVTVAAAWFPARRASQVPPVAAMRDDVALPARSLRVRLWVGSALAALGAAGLLVAVLTPDLPRRLPTAGAAVLALLLGVIMLAPVFSRAIVGVVGAPVARLGAVGRLAVRNAQRDRRRTAATATAILIGLALVTGIGTLGASTTASTDALVDDVITADFLVQPSSYVPFSPEVGDAVEAVPGVAFVSRVRQVPALIDGERATVTGVDPETISQVQTLGLEPGALVPGGTAVDSETAAAMGVTQGVEVTYTWPTRQTDELVVRQVYQGQEVFSGWVVANSELEAAGLPAVDSLLYVRLDDGADVAAVRSAFDTIEAQYPTVRIQDQTEFKESITDQINQLLNLVYALLGLSIIIAVFGVVNTLALSIIERTREIGMLRAVGTLRGQVRSMVRWESVVISFFGALTGVVLGLVLGVSLQRLLQDQGITELAVPWGLIIGVLVATGVVAVLAAVWPARRAANLDVLDAIRTE